MDLPCAEWHSMAVYWMECGSGDGDGLGAITQVLNKQFNWLRIYAEKHKR